MFTTTTKHSHLSQQPLIYPHDPQSYALPTSASSRLRRRCSTRWWLPSPIGPQAQLQHTHGCSSRGPILACNAVSHGKPETVTVVEYLLLLQAKPHVDPEEIEVLLDSLWSLQYMIPSVMYAAAGNITNCTLCKKRQRRQQSTDVSSSSSSSAEGIGQVALDPGMFSHAVHYRLSNRCALETLLLHPLMAAMQDEIHSQCANSAQLVFEGTVAKRLEALFRRGDEFASGVEHILLLQPGSNGGAGADAFLERLAALAESSVAGGIQASYGAVISCAHTAATHVLMTRFAAQQQIEQLLATPACVAVMQRDARVPVVAASSLCISIQPTEESTKVNGGSGSMGIR